MKRCKETLKMFDNGECKGCSCYKTCRKVYEDICNEAIGVEEALRDMFAENPEQV